MKMFVRTYCSVAEPVAMLQQPGRKESPCRRAPEKRSFGRNQDRRNGLQRFLRHGTHHGGLSRGFIYMLIKSEDIPNWLKNILSREGFSIGCSIGNRPQQKLSPPCRRSLLCPAGITRSEESRPDRSGKDRGIHRTDGYAGMAKALTEMTSDDIVKTIWIQD